MAVYGLPAPPIMASRRHPGGPRENPRDRSSRFIGSNYVRRLLSGDYPAHAESEVIVLDKLTYAGNEANLAPIAHSPRYTFVKGDICDAALLSELMPGVDAVVHFAAESHVDRSITGAADFVVTNVFGDTDAAAGGQGRQRRMIRACLHRQGLRRH